MKEKQRQHAKEEAILLALQNNKALIRRGLEIWALDKSGHAELLCKGSTYDSMWNDALIVITSGFLTKKGRHNKGRPKSS